MSAAEHRRGGEEDDRTRMSLLELDELRLRRSAARHRRRAARVDLGAGVLTAIALLLASPGLAITALVGALLLLFVVASLLLDRRRLRAPRGGRRRAGAGPAQRRRSAPAVEDPAQRPPGA